MTASQVQKCPQGLSEADLKDLVVHCHKSVGSSSNPITE